MKKYAYFFIVLIILLLPTYSFAEGTRQWSISATDYTFLKVSSVGTYAFAGYGVSSDRRLHIHIDNPASERVYIGLSRMVDEFTNTDLTTPYTFQIRSPSGAVVHGPYTVNTPNITSYAMAAAGPSALAAGGYPTSSAMWEFNPTESGDHYIEFANTGSIRWFDITVANTTLSSAIDGRVWAQAWTVRADNGYTSLANAFDTPFNGQLIAYDGEYATLIDFENSGIRPLEGQFSFNTTGPGNTGNLENDRRSVDSSNATNPEHKIFLNQPDSSIYPLQPQGQLQNLPLVVMDPNNPDINVEVTRAGQVEILLDFGGGSNDRRLFVDVVAGVNTVPWDGLTGTGTLVNIEDYPIPASISYTQGITHFTAYDVEGLDNGFNVYTQTTGGVIGPNLLYWDDSNIPDNPGTADAQVNIDTGSTIRRRWNQNNYGDLNTINTWWYAYQDKQTTTLVLPGDYGDAPNSYRTAFHVVPDTPTIYLGTAPDKETQSLNAANGGTDGTGDDNDNIDDEEGITLPILTDTDGTYTITATDISATGDGTLHAWVDFDGNGQFDADEHTSVLVNAGTPAGALNWTLDGTGGNPDFTVVGGDITFARFRFTSDASVTNVTPSSAASNGEVEDYGLTVQPGGYKVSGRVFNDANVDGINDVAEAGISDLTVVLYDVANGTCTSTRTNARGEYIFYGVALGNYQVYEAAQEAVPTPQACDPNQFRDPVGYLSSTSSTAPTFNVTNSDVSGIDFGDVLPPRFELDNEQVILPNTIVVHPHVFTAHSDGRVLFSIANDTADPTNLNWGTQLFLDGNCDAQLSGDDTPVTGAYDVNAEDKLCLLTKVLSPANITEGASHTLTVNSRFTYGDGSLITSLDLQQQTDITRTSSGISSEPVGGEGKLSLIKSVWNVTTNLSGDRALPGETLEYRIVYENIGNGSLNELVIHDSVPEFTTLVLGSQICATANTPPELPTCIIGTDGADGLSWAWAASEELNPGSSGSVSYQVTVE